MTGSADSFERALAPHRKAVDTLILRILQRPRSDQDGPVGVTTLVELTREHLATGGKRLRGLLPAALVSAAEGDVSAARLFGACVEAVHNGTLVHDDIQDGDELRRGRPTLWTTRGMPQAINAGDAMLVGPLAALLRTDLLQPTVAAELATLLADALLETICGQVADVAFREVERPELERAEAIAAAKTVPLFRCAFEGAVVLLGGTAEQRQAARDLGRQVGFAFQVRDDLLDALGVKGRGAAGADFREGKPTWPILSAIRAGPAGQAQELRDLLHRAARGERPDAVQVGRWTAWVDAHGGITEARTAVSTALAQARQSGTAAFPATSALIIEGLCDRLARIDG